LAAEPEMGKSWQLGFAAFAFEQSDNFTISGSFVSIELTLGIHPALSFRG